MNGVQITRIAEFVSHWAAKMPDSEALVSEGERLAYRVLNERVDQCARALTAAGVTRSDRVAVLCTPRWESFIVLYALCRIGASWVGLNPRHLIGELAYVVEDSQPVALFGMASFEERDYRELLLELAETYPRIKHRIAMTGRAEGFVNLGEFLAGADTIDEPAYQAAIAAVSPEDCAAVVYTSGSTGQPKGAMLP